MKMLDIRIAGIHSLCYEYGTIEENTHGMVQVISNPFIHIISHPGDGTAALHFEPMVLAAKEHHTLLEINNSSLNPPVTNPMPVRTTSPFSVYARNMKFRSFWEVTRIFRLI